jgi:hypothetical protein
MKKIEMIVEKTGTGFSAYSTRFPVATVGKDLPDLRKKMVEALNLYFEDGQRTVSAEDLRIILDIPQFFEFYKIINAKAFSEKIGMNQSLLAQYIRGIKKPSVSQSRRIIEGIRQVGKELSEIRFL